MAFEKNLKTRIVLTHDEYSNLKTKHLKEGEVVLAKVGEITEGNVTQPVFMMKVGTSETTKTVAELPWLMAPAADVYGWAKKENLEASALPVIPGDKLGLTVNVTGDGNAITGASWDATTKTITLTKGETFATKAEFDDHNHDDEYKKIQTAITEVGEASKTLKISQDAQGVITATPVDIAITSTQVTDFESEVKDIVGSMGIAGSEEVAGISGRLTTAESEIDALQNDVTTTIPNLVDTKLAGYNTTAVQKGIDDAQDARIKAIEDTYAKAADVETSIGELEDVDAGLAEAIEQALADAKDYTDEVKAGILGEGITETFDTLKEIEDWITKQGGSTVELTKAIADEAKAREDADKAINDELDTFGDIVTHNASEFAKADIDTGVHTVTLEGGTDNGTLKLTVDGETTDNISVTGLGSAAYASRDDFDVAGSASAAGEAARSTAQGYTDGAISDLRDELMGDNDDIFTSKTLEGMESTLYSVMDAIGSGDATTGIGENGHSHNLYDVQKGDRTTLQAAKDYADGLADNYATAAQGGKADTAIQEVTTTDNKGLKVTKNGTSVNVDIDDTVVFVLDGGTAADLD